MSDKQRKMRLAWFVLLSAGIFAVAVSCDTDRPVALFDQTPAVVQERQTGSIGQRLRDPDHNNKSSPAYVSYDDYLIYARSFGFTYAAAGRTTNHDGTTRSARNINSDSIECINCHGSMADGYVGPDGKKKENAYHNMHDPAKLADVLISCVDCHGGNGLEKDKDKAHVQPNPQTRWIWEDKDGKLGGPPKLPVVLTLQENPDYIRFVNPGDLRASWVTCYACHADAVEKNATSIMASGPMLWEAALYNNGSINRKNAIYGEFYMTDGTAARVVAPIPPTAEQTRTKGWLPFLGPLPRWEVSQTGNSLRVFERGGEERPVIGIPNPKEEDGHPDVKLSIRGPGTQLRTDPVLIGLQKTRLLDPTLNLVGTNDHPGDYRGSGCTACHCVYANDRSPVHSGVWAHYGNQGFTASTDISLSEEKAQSGHPILHYFVQQIPVSTCIVCHIHPGTNVLNEYTGYMWWDNETDGRAMYPKLQRNVTAEDEAIAYAHNPEGANVRGLWSDMSQFADTPAEKAKFANEQDQFGNPVEGDFLQSLYTMNDNPELEHTRFADFHGHGWVFRAVYKKDRHGNLLDADGNIIPEVTRADLNYAAEYTATIGSNGLVKDTYPDGKPVHLKDIHLEMGMQCADCHFENDSHGNGHLYGATRDAVGEDCVDCHGTVDKPAMILTYLNEGVSIDDAQSSVASKQRALENVQKRLKTAIAAKRPAAQINTLKRQVANAQRGLTRAKADYARISNEYNHIWSGTGAAGPPNQYDLQHFEVDDGKLYQLSTGWQADPARADQLHMPRKWLVVQTGDVLVKSSDWAKGPGARAYHTSDGVNTTHLDRALYAHTVRQDLSWGTLPKPNDKIGLAHENSNVSCYACHTSWNTSCFGCHLPQRADQRKDMLHYEGEETRNYTNYNYQTLRDDMYMLGRDATTRGNKIVPVRSACAVMVSSQDALRRWIYVQQQTVSAQGYAGTAFSPYYPHTVRAAETRECSDCHLHKDADGHVDNNAVMAQLLMQGVNAYNFIGRFCWVGCGDDGLHAIAVTTRDEPQAVFGSRLQEEAYPSDYARHVANGLNLTESYEHPGNVRDVQMRGEYCYAACGKDGFIAYDIAAIDDKDFAERITLAPVSPFGQRFYIHSQDATCICSPSTLALNPAKQMRPENEERPISLFYAFLYLTDSKEGLIVIGNPLDSPNGPGVSTLLDGDPQNNFLERAVTYNPGGILAGARHCDMYGTYAYICCDAGIVVVDLADPLHPRVVNTITDVDHAKKIQFQFRYGFAVDAGGMKVYDVTDPTRPQRVQGADLSFEDARDIYLCRTYAYVADGKDGLAIVDIEKPEAPRIDQIFNRDPATNIMLTDTNAVKIGMTNASLYAYVADGVNGLKVLQLTSSDDRDADPGHTSWQFLGFSPHPHPRLIAMFRTPGPALCISKGLDRDRAVDESGNQLSVFGRRGARPMDLQEQRMMYTLAQPDGTRKLFFVQDGPSADTRK
ncbi:MAG TPA: hypothetical protein VL992_14150 [Tepidisphaeraceae bacterium]|nr:hypothetical protein [Tepidisphaeraceae bacterium]